MYKIDTQRYKVPRRPTWMGVGALFLGLFLNSTPVHAAAPAAATSIGNTASASFTDVLGKAGVVTSNTVVTVVQQVGAFNLDKAAASTNPVIITKVGIAGSTVYAPHVLYNIGNGQDSFNITAAAPAGIFTKIEIYADDGTGNPAGASLCSNATSCVTTVPVTVAGTNGVFKFVVAYTIPSVPSTTANPYGTVSLSAAPITASVPMYSAPNSGVRDIVNLTTGAAMTLKKFIGAPAVAAAGGSSWPTAAIAGKASTSSTCPTTWAAGFTATAGCTYTVYTLQLENAGLATGAFALTDTLPDGMTYVAGSAVWSGAPGVALTDAAAGDSAGIDYQFTAKKISAVVTALHQLNTQTISFVVLINSSASTGTASTTNIAYYNPADAGTKATSTIPGDVITPTGIAPFSVNGSYGVVVGSLASTSTTALDQTPGTPNTSAADVTTVAGVVSGATVKFSQIVYNVGKTTDSVNLAVAPGTFPAGTVFFLYAADGASPLSDTGVLDGIPDTGPILAGGQATVVVAATLPTGVGSGTVTYSAVLTGTSSSDPTQKDATRDSISSISTGVMDLTNTVGGNGIPGTTGNGDTGPGPSPLPTIINTTNPGATTAFNLYIANNDSAARTYALAASGSNNSAGSLPANWSVKFLAGANAACSATAVGISTTASIAPSANEGFTACVTVSASQAPATALKIYFKATATAANAAGITANDTLTDAVTITTASTYIATILGNNLGQLTSPGSVVYVHSLMNSGNQNCGPYTLQVTQTAADIAAGWTSAIYLDNDGDNVIGTLDTLVTAQITAPLLPGADHAQKFLVRIGAPSGLSIGAVNSSVVTATFAPGATSCGSPSVTDSSTINTGSIRLSKSHALDAACDGVADGTLTTSAINVKPGGCIFYEVRAINEGSGPLNNLLISDSAPTFTTLSKTQPAVACAQTNITGTVEFKTAGAAVSCGGAVNVVNPGGTLTMQYTVTIDK